MRKNVWQMTSKDIVVFEFEQAPKHKFRWNRDIKEFRPGIGKVLVRELVCIDDLTLKRKFIRGIEVIVIDERLQ